MKLLALLALAPIRRADCISGTCPAWGEGKWPEGCTCYQRGQRRLLLCKIGICTTILLFLFCVFATAAEARHHHRGMHAHSAAIPLPRVRPVIKESLKTETIWLVSDNSPQGRINDVFYALGRK